MLYVLKLFQLLLLVCDYGKSITFHFFLKWLENHNLILVAERHKSNEQNSYLADLRLHAHNHIAFFENQLRLLPSNLLLTSSFYLLFFCFSGKIILWLRDQVFILGWLVCGCIFRLLNRLHSSPVQVAAPTLTVEKSKQGLTQCLLGGFPDLV